MRSFAFFEVLLVNIRVTRNGLGVKGATVFEHILARLEQVKLSSSRPSTNRASKDLGFSDQNLNLTVGALINRIAHSSISTIQRLS